MIDNETCSNIKTTNNNDNQSTNLNYYLAGFIKVYLNLTKKIN